MNFFCRFIASVLLMFHCGAAISQESTDSLRRHSLAGFPIVFYSPETNWGFGGAGIFTFHFKGDSLNARPSKIQTGFAFTLNRQILLYLPFQFFPKNSSWNCYGELGYYKYSYNFYGIGNINGRDTFEKYNVNYPRLRVNVLRKLLPGFYAGIRYWFEDDKMISVNPGGQLDTGMITGKSGGKISGAGIVINFDTRDDLFYPEKGVLIESSVQLYAKVFLSDYSFRRLSLDGSVYMSPYKHHVIALNFVFEVNSGEVPFNYMSMIGGTKRMRGYYEGRYRDKNLFIGQAEYRAMIYKRLGAAVFAGCGSVSGQVSELPVAHFRFAYGAGLRLKLSKKEKINVRFDAGFGKRTSAFYLTIGEAF